MFGRILISLISCVFCDLRARLAFFWASYLYLPTSRNLQTGGAALGATSTRSRPTSPACSIASAVSKTPRFSPFSSITRTLGTEMNSLKRGPWSGGAAGGRVMGGRMLLFPDGSLVAGYLVANGHEGKARARLLLTSPVFLPSCTSRLNGRRTD